MMFPCKKCGLCCRNLDKSPIFDELHNGDGICKYLDGNLCSIYEKRPLLCRVDECYYKYFSSSMTLDEYYKLNLEVCNKFMKEERI